MTADNPRFAQRLRELMQARGISYRALAARTYYGKSYLHDLATGRKQPTVEAVRRLDEALGADGALMAAVPSDDELDALELARRISASDVSSETLTQLEHAFDDLATRYATTPPDELIPRMWRHLDYVSQLLDARKTLAQHRRLLVLGGWLSLFGATLHIDLRQPAAAAARLSVAQQLAQHGEHAEIQAWCLETRAWEVLTDGGYQQAIRLSQQAQVIAPKGSSAHIQATAQEGRGWARMGQRTETRGALDRVARLVSSLPPPDRPEHHYRYDPDKALAYTATTLAWSGDPAAEEYARAAIRQLEAGNGIARPRRAASARLDLGLALVVTGKLDEAASTAIAAISSGRVVPSNWWRATEIVTAVQAAGLPEAADLREAYEAFRPVSTGEGGQ